MFGPAQHPRRNPRTINVIQSWNRILSHTFVLFGSFDLHPFEFRTTGLTRISGGSGFLGWGRRRGIRWGVGCRGYSLGYDAFFKRFFDTLINVQIARGC